MTKIEFTINLAASPKQLLEVVKDYENYSFYLPDQIKSVKIIKNEEGVIVTEDIFIFKTIIKKEIKQESKHEVIDNQAIIEILSGPAKNSIVKVYFEKIDSGCHILVNMDLKLGFKGKIFTPIIKKLYPIILTGVFYKMNTKALDIEMS
jgi:ribosome-associated toxin RatA of RatAB toxin-antitoxin module